MNQFQRGRVATLIKSVACDASIASMIGCSEGAVRAIRETVGEENAEDVFDDGAQAPSKPQSRHIRRTSGKRPEHIRSGAEDGPVRTIRAGNDAGNQGVARPSSGVKKNRSIDPGYSGCAVPSDAAIVQGDTGRRVAAEIGSRNLLVALHRLLEKGGR